MYTTQAQIRKSFWQTFPEADRKKITDYSGKGKMYKTDTRVLFADYLDSLHRDGQISNALAQRATLSK